MPRHTHLKWRCQFKETFDSYLQTKNLLHPSCFLWDIAKILQTCYFLVLWVCLASNTQNKWYNRLVELCQIWDWWWNINNNISLNFISLSGKTYDKIFEKLQKNLLWGHFGSFLPKFWEKWIFLEKWTVSDVKYSNYLPPCQKSEKTNNPFLRKMSNSRMDRQTDGQWWFYRTLRKMGVQ